MKFQPSTQLQRPACWSPSQSTPRTGGRHARTTSLCLAYFPQQHSRHCCLTNSSYDYVFFMIRSTHQQSTEGEACGHEFYHQDPPWKERIPERCPLLPLSMSCNVYTHPHTYSNKTKSRVPLAESGVPRGVAGGPQGDTLMTAADPSRS